MSRFTKICVITFTFGASCALYAASINDILVKSATSRLVSQDMVRSNMTMQIGDEFSPETLSEDIKTLYATKQFDDIEAKVEPTNTGSVTITLTITPKAVISEIVFQGNSLISTKKLRREVDLKENEIQDEKLLSEDLQALYDLYRNKGYHDTTIKQQVVPLEDSHHLKVVYEINEKSRYKTRGVDLIGNIVFSDRQLEKMMETEVSLLGYIFPAGYFDETELQNDIDSIKNAYWDKGYLDFKLSKIDRYITKDGKDIHLTLFLEEGPQYSVKDISISGNTEFSTEQLTEIISLQSGEVYSSGQERRDINAITNKYSHKGYLDCYVLPDRSIESENNTASVEYIIREGTAYTIRNINIAGNHITKDHVIRRELRIHPGDVSDISKIEASKTSLQNLGYFENVDILPVSTEENDKKDLNVNLDEKLTGQLLFGAGFSSTDNLVGTIEVSQSNFDLHDFPGLRGGGQRMRLRAQFGSSRQDYVLSFTEPWLNDKPLRFDFEIWSRTTSSNREYDQDSKGSSVAFTRRLKKKFWRQSFGYRIEDIDINDIEGDYSKLFRDAEEGGDLVSAFTLGFVRDHRDRVILTSSGSRISINSEFQTEAIGSYSNLYKLTLSADKYYPIFKKTVFKISGEIGQVDNVSGDTPRIFDRFFTGGANSIRGFKERDVGPVDPDNEEPVGGQSILLASVEVTTPLYEKTVMGSIFVDSGNVWKDEFDWTPSELNVGVGAGLRLFLPIGAIQLDYGWPVSREQKHLGTGGRFHFNLGYNF